MNFDTSGLIRQKYNNISYRLESTSQRKISQKAGVIEQGEIYHLSPLWVVRDTKQLIVPPALLVVFACTAGWLNMHARVSNAPTRAKNLIKPDFAFRSVPQPAKNYRSAPSSKESSMCIFFLWTLPKHPPVTQNFFLARSRTRSKEIKAGALEQILNAGGSFFAWPKGKRRMNSNMQQSWVDLLCHFLYQPCYPDPKIIHRYIWKISLDGRYCVCCDEHQFIIFGGLGIKLLVTKKL